MSTQRAFAPPGAAEVLKLPDPLEAIRSVADVTRYHARHRPAHLASRFEGRATSYGELDQRCSQIARALQSERLRRGDRVIYLGSNCDEYFELLFGCAKAGVVLVPVSQRLSPPQIAYIVGETDARLLFVGPELADFVSPVAMLQRIVSMGERRSDWPSFAEWYGRHPADDPMVTFELAEPVLQLYTPGTTGQPKGVQLSHANLLTAAFGGPDQTWARWQAEDISLVALPVAQLGGTDWGYLGYCFGALNVIMRRFDAAQALEHIEQEHITRAFFTPTAIEKMLQVRRVLDMDFLLFNCLVYGGGPMSLPLLREAIEVFQCEFCQVYGLTETSGPITCLPPEDHDVGGHTRMRSAGRPLAGVELRIRRSDGSIAAPNESGEIETRSARNMLGYWRAEGNRTRALSEDGWLRTGDMGYLDRHGYLYVQGRLLDMAIAATRANRSRRSGAIAGAA